MDYTRHRHNNDNSEEAEELEVDFLLQVTSGENGL